MHFGKLKEGVFSESIHVLLNLSLVAPNFAQKRGNTISDVTESCYHPIYKQAAHPCK
jgi:hypothetical protein